MEELDRQEALTVIGHRFDALKLKYEQCPELTTYLSRVAEDMSTHQEDFRAAEQAGPRHDEQHHGTPPFPLSRESHGVEQGRERARSCRRTAPPITTCSAELEYQPVAGGAVTDFTLLKPGATHRANGGFLILQVLDVLLSPFAWEALKRTMRSRRPPSRTSGSSTRRFRRPASGRSQSRST